MFQLILGHGIQHIALILGGIRPLQQPASRFIPADLSVVAGGHIVKAQLRRPPQHGVEFHVAVAGDAGIGCTSS